MTPIMEEEKLNTQSTAQLLISESPSLTTVSTEKPNYMFVYGCRPCEGILSDQMSIKGIPWSILKHKVLDDSFDAQAFG